MVSGATTRGLFSSAGPDVVVGAGGVAPKFGIVGVPLGAGELKSTGGVGGGGNKS